MGPLPKNTSKKQVLDFFKDYNPVSCKIIHKSETNIFSFIYFNNETDRDNAIAANKGKTFRGNSVVVNRSFNAYEGPRLGGKERYDSDFEDIIYY